jgi:threonine aldolase
MRQVGIIAAAGHYALEHNLARIADDHRRAATLADRLSKVAPGALSPVDTNIILIDLTNSNTDGQSFVAAAKERSIWVSSLGPKLVRLITHLDIDDADMDRASEVLSALLQKAFVSK